MDAGKVLIVEILSYKNFAVDRLNQSENGGVEVVGRIFPIPGETPIRYAGLYASRICMLSNPKK
ncbi:MAG: hypothetical protein ACK521_11595 [bacterium]|jgi:hypothetical protein